MMKQLLLFALKGKKFAVWKEDIKDIRKIGALSHLHIDRSGTFDVTLIDDRITYLYDLSVCLGLAATEMEKKENALIIPGGNEATGFTVEGKIKQISVAPEKTHPLPDYLKTDIINTVIEYGSKPVPVINLSQLHACFQQPEHKAPVPGLRLPRIKRKEDPYGDCFWTFSCCCHFFTVLHGYIETVQVKSENILKLPFIPCYVEGIIIRNGRVLPLIRLSDCLGLAERTVPESALILEEAGQCFGFLVDSVCENLDVESVQVVPLPPLAASAWLRKAILSKQGIMPCIHPFILLKAQQDKVTEQIPSQQYTLDSRFPSLQYKEEIEVVEFTILGVKQAIPGCEMEDTVPFRPFWQVPTQNPVVIGVAEHEGTILPVLDLAPYFGKKLAPTPDWNMVLITNGDFQALLIAETVIGKRRIAVNLQKELPVHLSEDVVYGCYLDKDAVTLILNTASMAFYAEGLNMKELSSVLTAVEAPGAEALDISFEQSRKTGYTDRQETGVESKIASVMFKKAEIEKGEINEIEDIDEKAYVNGAASDLLPELEEKPGALKRDAQGKGEREKEKPVDGTKAAPVSEDEAAAREETDDTETGPQKIEEVLAAGYPETKEIGKSIQSQVSPSLVDSGEAYGDKPHCRKKPIWYFIASVLAVCLLVAGYFIFAPADWKPGDASTGRKHESITVEKEITAFPSESASEEDGEAGETVQASREETVAYLIHFPPDSSLLLRDEIDNLRSIADSIKQDPPSKIIITGHTARVGTEESCLILSKERAEAVRSKLLSLSAFDESRIITLGAGTNEPIDDQSTLEGRSRNRRAEIRFVY